MFDDQQAPATKSDLAALEVRFFGDMGDLKGEMGILKGDVVILKGEMIEMKGDMTTMKGEMTEMKGDMKILIEFIKNLSTDVRNLKSDLLEEMDRRLERQWADNLVLFENFKHDLLGAMSDITVGLRDKVDDHERRIIDVEHKLVSIA